MGELRRLVLVIDTTLRGAGYKVNYSFLNFEKENKSLSTKNYSEKNFSVFV